MRNYSELPLLCYCVLNSWLCVLPGDLLNEFARGKKSLSMTIFIFHWAFKKVYLVSRTKSSLIVQKQGPSGENPCQKWGLCASTLSFHEHPLLYTLYLSPENSTWWCLVESMVPSSGKGTLEWACSALLFSFLALSHLETTKSPVRVLNAFTGLCISASGFKTSLTWDNSTWLPRKLGILYRIIILNNHSNYHYLLYLNYHYMNLC